MKLSDYLAEFLHERVADVVFGYQGSSVCHIIDSISNQPELTFVETRHEQGAAFAANAYAEVHRSAGIAVACSGPGAINLVTGIANAFYDSIPCLFICGQVSTGELRTNLQMRQLGFQETDIVGMVHGISKYAVQIDHPERIAYELEKAVWHMWEGRPGPVLLDIPHNVQRSEVDPQSMEHFNAPEREATIDQTVFAEIETAMNNAKRPLILLGGGCCQLYRHPELRAFLGGLKAPIVVSYRGRDVWASEDANYCGVIGAYGNRAANWAVHYSDVLLCLGSRLDGRQTGGDMDSFAPNADLFVVDIDPIEVQEKPKRVRGICMNAIDFLTVLSTRGRLKPTDGHWCEVVQKWQMRMPISMDYKLPGVNPNRLAEHLGRIANSGTVFTTDVGQNQIWVNASLVLKQGARLLQSCGLGSMGYALPAAIGASFAQPGRPVICLCGDGGFQMNMQEMQVIQLYRLPVKVFVLDNRSLGLIRVYQDKALGKRLNGSVKGFGSPAYEELARAYGFEYIRIEGDVDDDTLCAMVESPAPLLVEVCISKDSTCCPEPTYMQTVENQSPLLSDTMLEQMKREAENI